MNYVSLILFFFISMTSCQEKNTQSPKNSEITSIETGSEELNITLLEDNFNLVIIESEENILNSIKKNIEEKEALGLTEDKELEAGEAGLIGTIAVSFSVALGAIVGLSIHKNLQKNKSREDLYTPSLKPINLSSSKFLNSKTIELSEGIATSLNLKKNITEKELAKNTLDKLDQGKSLAFNSKDAADNVQKFLEQKFSLTEKEMRVIEVNGRFHLVSWQKMFTAEDKPFLVMKVETDFAKISNDLAEQVKTKDYVLVVNPKNTNDVENIENFINSNKEKILVQKQTSQTPDGKDIYVLTNKELQENLLALTELTKSNKKIELKEISDEKYPDNDDGTPNNKNDRKQITHVFGEAIKTKRTQIEQFERVEKTLTEYLKKNPNNNGLSELKDITKALKEKLQETVKDLNPDDSIKFNKTGHITFDLEQKHLDAFQKHYTDPQLYRLYRESTRIIIENKLNKQDGDLYLSLLKIDLKVNKEGATLRSMVGFNSDLAPLFQSIPRLSMPLDQDWLKKYSWFSEAVETIRKYVAFINDEGKIKN